MTQSVPAAASSIMLTDALPPLQAVAEQELFSMHFERWRAANGSAIALTLATGITLHYLTQSNALWWWTLLTVAAYVHKALWNLLHESHHFSYQRWLGLSIAFKGLCGLAAGALVFFIPPEQTGLLIVAILVSSAFSLGEANTCGHWVLLHTTLLSQAVMTCFALLFYAHLPLGVIPCVLFTGTVLYYGRVLLESNRNNLIQRLLAQQLARDLEQRQRQLLEAQHQQSVLQERQRVMQDMHDGLGSTLSSSLVLLEHGNLSVPEAAATMRECIDDLRLVIDSLEPTARDIPTLLGMLRWRLQHKIEAAGIRLIWHMDDLPALTWLEPSLALSLLRLVQEAIANSLKHSHASELQVSARLQGDAILLLVADNGVGFDLQSPVTRGRGIQTLHSRARQLGGELSLDSQPGQGTRLHLSLPLSR